MYKLINFAFFNKYFANRIKSKIFINIIIFSSCFRRVIKYDFFKAMKHLISFENYQFNIKLKTADVQTPKLDHETKINTYKYDILQGKARDIFDCTSLI